MAGASKLKISIWSDYVCPFCYLGEPVFSRLKEEFKDRLEIEWRAFELRPEPEPILEPGGEYLERTWRQSVYPMAQERGMFLRLPPVQPRSRKALEAAEYARVHFRFHKMHHALFKAYFEDGLNIGEIPVLVKIAESIGLNGIELRTSLEQGKYTFKVLADDGLGRRLGINGVPTLLFRRQPDTLERGVLISGAHPYESLRSLVKMMLESEEDLRALFSHAG